MGWSERAWLGHTFALGTLEELAPQELQAISVQRLNPAGRQGMVKLAALQLPQTLGKEVDLAAAAA